MDKSEIKNNSEQEIAEHLATIERVQMGFEGPHGKLNIIVKLPLNLKNSGTCDLNLLF
jgi:hypothetical protein